MKLVCFESLCEKSVGKVSASGKAQVSGHGRV